MLYSLLGHKAEVLEKSMIHKNEVENKCETKKKSVSDQVQVGATFLITLII